MSEVYLVHTNFDYEEHERAFRTLVEVVAYLADVFELEGTEYDRAEFWRRIDEEYARGDWKGLTINVLDTETLAVKPYVY